MKKISIVFDGGHYSKGALEFVRQLNEVTPVSVTGCFLKQEHFVENWSPVPYAAASTFALENEDILLDSTIQRFTHDCEKLHLNFKVRHYKTTSGMDYLRKLSRFSDALVVSSELYFRNVNEVQPNEFLKDLLHISECPVFTVPEKFTFPSTIILAYDGSESSLFAIKEFANLFPELCDRKTMLLHGYQENEDIPELNTIRDLASCHFSNFGFYSLHLSNKKQFNNWLQEVKYPLVVSGSFGRSHLHEFIRKSFVSDTIHDHKAIVFTAHR
jgi:hypothetical protein